MAYKKLGRKLLRKNVGKARKYLNKRYGGKNSFRNVLTDIARLKSLVNAEKKNFSLASGTNPIGQVDADAEGSYIADITPTPGQGDGESQRSGDSIKLSTAVLNLQFKQQSGKLGNTKGVIEIYQVLGTPQNITTMRDQLYTPNPWITGASIRDYSAMYNQDYRQQYRCIFKRRFNLKADTTGSQTVHTTFKYPIRFGKFGQHIKYVDGTTTVASGQIVMVIRIDSGNMSSTTNSTLNNIVTANALTGINMNRNIEFYYFDN